MILKSKFIEKFDGTSIFYAAVKMWRTISRYIPFALRKTFFKLYRRKKREMKKLCADSGQTGKKIIVSLTSHTKRMKHIDIAVTSLFCQTCPPDKIILYLGSDVNPCDIPRRLKRLKKYGLEIINVPDNLGPHKKYFYSMREYPNDLIITVDDDYFMCENLIESLMSEHKKYPNAVIAARADGIKFDENGCILPYAEFDIPAKPSERKPSMEYIAVGCCGILYPPGVIGVEFFDEKLIKELALTTDDLWLKAAEIKSGTPVQLLPKNVRDNSYEITIQQFCALQDKNIPIQNDINFARIMNHFNISPSDFKN